jgi:hypothetical protein
MQVGGLWRRRLLAIPAKIGAESEKLRFSFPKFFSDLRG